MDSNWTSRLNPELVRSIRTTLPPKRALFIGVLTIVLVHVVGAVIWNNAASRRYLTSTEQVREAGEQMYWVLMLVLFALLFVLTPATAALSFIQEKVRGTSIFQQMVLLRPLSIAVGKFIGSGLIGYFVAALIFPFFFVSAVIGNIDARQFVRVSLFLLIGGLCCQAVGLLISAALSGPTDRFLRGNLLVGPAVGGMGALLAVALHSYFDRYIYYGGTYWRWNFFGWQIRAYLVILGLLAFVGAWAFAGTVRRIKASQLIPLRPWPTWLFFASAEAVLIGLFWGGFTQPYDFRIFEMPPIARLIFYLLLNWAALVILAGSTALSRERLREWWSASDDPLAVFQRQEIKNVLITFGAALGIALAGLTALWASFHIYTAPTPQAVSSPAQLIAIAICFTLTVSGMAVFIQYCALHRFRIGAWAGVSLAIIFYLVMGVVGASLEDKKNTAALLNPLVYANAITEGDPYMDRHKTYGVTQEPKPDVSEGTLIHGLLAETLLAAGCFGLALVKWRKTEEEMLHEGT